MSTKQAGIRKIFKKFLIRPRPAAFDLLNSKHSQVPQLKIVEAVKIPMQLYEEPKT